MSFLMAVASLASIIALIIYGLNWIIKTVKPPIQKDMPHHVSQEELRSSPKQGYKIRFFYDWGCDSPFWCGNEAARAKFGVGLIEPEALGLSLQTIETVRALAKWHDTSLNCDYPPHPGPWRQGECDRFNAAVDNLLEAIRTELSAEYDIIDQQWRVSEDPDLDRYLANPKSFRR